MNQNLIFNIKDKNFYIFGIGFIGSNLAFQLVKGGAGKLFFFDKDKVEPKNISNQLYTKEQIDMNKVDALYKILNINNINTRLFYKNIDLTKNDFLKKLKIIGNSGNIIIIAVDDFKVRKKIYEDLLLNNSKNIELIIDIRTDIKLGYIKFIIPNKQTITKEINNLNTLINNNKNKKEESICGNKNTIFYGQLLVSLLLNNYMNFINNKKYYKDIIYFFEEMKLYTK